MKRLAMSFSILISLLVVPISTMAHHGSAGYDMNKPVTETGVVTSFQFVNPHSQVYFDVKDDNGSIEHWGIELATPTLLVRKGWNSKTLKEGDQIIATCYRAKNGLNHLFHCTKIVRNGEELHPDEGN